MEFFNPEGWPRPSGYTSAVVGQGRQVHLAGQIGWNPVTQKMEAANLVDEARQALGNLVEALAAAGGRPDQIISVNWYITDRHAYLANAREIGAAWREIVGKHFPAMTMVEISGILLEDAHMEINAIACLE